MTGFEEAVEWLDQNAPMWRLRRAETTLEAGRTLGAPTEQMVRVELSDTAGRVTLTGEGSTMLEAAQRAVGAWEAR